MKLNEIIKIVSQPNLGFDISLIKNLKIIKVNYLNQDYHIEQGNIEDLFVFVVKEGDKFIGAILATEIEDLHLNSSKKVLMIKRTWCSHEYRGRGIISNLYRFIYNDRKYALISDVEQSPESVKIWDKLRTSWDVKMINLRTKEISPINTTDLYGNSDYALIVESFQSNQTYDGVIKDYMFGMNGD